MRIIKCYKCKQDKEEIEFDYAFFKKQYSRVCKLCQQEVAENLGSVDSWSLSGTTF